MREKKQKSAPVAVLSDEDEQKLSERPASCSLPMTSLTELLADHACQCRSDRCTEFLGCMLTFIHPLEGEQYRGMEEGKMEM